MISVKQALQIIEDEVRPTTVSEIRKLEEAPGYVLSKPVVSPINMPPFRQSAMDGFALHLHDKETYELIGEVKAGDGFNPALKKGEAVRIFTGAPVPDSANTVVIQENTTVSDSLVQLTSGVAFDENIRPAGEQITRDSIALKTGTVLTPAAIGFLASIGITEVPVYQKPTIAIVTTGNELIPPGQPLADGQIYESNAIMLLTALNSIGYDQVEVQKVEDDYQKTCSCLETVIGQNDMVLITGGISVGDYDFVGRALEALQVQKLFYKVNQKPGKPLFLGTKEGTVVFGLPGNPAAALSCFYLYVQMALYRISGNTNFQFRKTSERSASSFVKKGSRPQLLKAIYNNNEATLLEGQSSSMLQTFAIANAMVYLPESVEKVNAGDVVEVIHLPN